MFQFTSNILNRKFCIFRYADLKNKIKKAVSVYYCYTPTAFLISDYIFLLHFTTGFRAALTSSNLLISVL